MRIVVQEWERVLRYRNGRFVEELGPGVHRRARRHASITRCDVRLRLLPIPGQEVLTADGLSVRLTIIAKVRVTDARRHHEAVADPDSFLYSAVQIAVREAVAARTLEELLAARVELAAELVQNATPTADECGIALESVSVRDLMVPAELRRAAGELATAKAQGLAALERARAEVAATRALSNAARMIADNPALLQLRTLQDAENGRATVVLTADPTVLSIPPRA